MSTSNTPAGTPESVPPLVMAPTPASISDKLDRLIDTTTDTRLAVATISGELREVGRRMDTHDRIASDVETRVRKLELTIAAHDHTDADGRDIELRVRALERFRYAVPSAAVVLAALSLLLAAWQALGK